MATWAIRQQNKYRKQGMAANKLRGVEGLTFVPNNFNVGAWIDISSKYERSQIHVDSARLLSNSAWFIRINLKLGFDKSSLRSN